MDAARDSHLRGLIPPQTANVPRGTSANLARRSTRHPERSRARSLRRAESKDPERAHLTHTYGSFPAKTVNVPRGTSEKSVAKAVDGTGFFEGPLGPSAERFPMKLRTAPLRMTEFGAAKADVPRGTFEPKSL